MSAKFYEIDQNNSGGSFVTNDKLCQRLVIQADTEKHALEIAEDLGCYWNGCNAGIDCHCCGDRWSQYTDELDPLDLTYGDKKFDTIEEYCQHVADQYAWTTPTTRIFYLDGKVKEIYSKKLKP